MTAFALWTLALAAGAGAPAPSMVDASGFSFEEDSKIQRVAEAYAADAVDFARQQFRLSLDWSDRSVQHIETMLGVLHDTKGAAKPPEEQVAKFSKLFGSYLGEVFRRNHGASWGVTRVNGQKVAGMKTKATGSLVWPWGLAQNRIVSGPDGNVWDYYRTLLRKEGAEAPPSSPPSAPTAKPAP